ncbi:MAG TPA: PDZ domain-containing protein [Pirellulales bacterium]|nr:PDZ domain-containing protein [Pirellulales bacterium]
MKHRISICRLLFMAMVCLSALSRVAMALEDLASREESALRAAAEHVAPCVVSIETVGGMERVGQMLVGSGAGTGLIISSDGYIVSSAFNFAQKPSGILVSLADGRRLAARLVATDRNRMLVLLKVETDKPLPTPEAAPADELRVGQWAVALGRTFERSQPNMSIGIVSGLNRIWGKAVQTDARISPSNYGGPLVDIRGRVIGVLVPLSPDRATELAGVEWYDSGIGFAVPLAQLEDRLSQLKSGHDLAPGLIGIAIEPGDMYVDPPIIKSARPNSPASKAGLRPGDKIVAVDGTAISRRVDLSGVINRHYAGDTLKLTVLRDGNRIESDVTLAESIEPYRRPFLGILPGASDGLVTVRWVYPDSPAAKANVQAGDVIIAVEDHKIGEAQEDLASCIAAQSVDQTVTLKIRRGSEELAMTAALGTEPVAVPEELPPRESSKAPKKRKGPTLGKFDLEVGEFTNECVVYVPTSYDPRQSFGLFVWLHGTGEFDAEALVERWKKYCDRDRFILVVPKSGTAEGWKMQDVAFVNRAVETMLADYTIDPLRVALHGYQNGGALACLAAWKNREHVRGVATVESVIAGEPAENDPEHRLAFYIAGTKTKDSERIKLLQELKYPVTVHALDKADYLNDAALAEMLRWFDSLDKI